MTPLQAKSFLQFVILMHIVGGLLLPFIVDLSIFDFYNRQLAEAFQLNSSESREQTTFLIGLFGPTVASWGVLFLYILNSSFNRPSKGAWWTMFAACLVWAPYDSWLSIQQGVYLNAVINAGALISLLVPLFIIRTYFWEYSNNSI